MSNNATKQNRAGRLPRQQLLFLFLLFVIVIGCETAYQRALREYDCVWQDIPEKNAHGWCCASMLPNGCYLQDLRDGTNYGNSLGCLNATE